MDFHTLSRRELQVLCKKNKIAANMTNVAMVDALAALQHVEGLEELLNPSEPTIAMQSPEKALPATPAVARTAARASARAKPRKDPDSLQVMSRGRRSTMSSRHAEDRENKQVNLPDTPAVSITGKRAGPASARGRPQAMKGDENNEEEKQGMPKSSTVKSTQRKARASAAPVPKVYSTRRSVRLLEKSMSELKLSEERASEFKPIKMDDLGLKEESEEVLEEIEENVNTLDGDSQAAEEESTEKSDHSNVPLEKSTGKEEKERELESDVIVESGCSEVLLEAECGKSDCLGALSDSDLKDDVLDEKSDQLDVTLLVSTLNKDVPPVDALAAPTDRHNTFAEIEDHHVEETTDLEISEDLAFAEDKPSDDIDVDVKCKTEEKLLDENNEGALVSETIICSSDDSDRLVPHITENSDRLVPHCDDIQEPIGDNDSDVEISVSSQLEIRDSAPAEKEESIKLDLLTSLASPIIQTEKHEDEQLVEVNVIESGEFAMEVREWHKSLVETSATAKSSEVNSPDVELVDVHVMPEVEFVEGVCELPPSAIADRTPIVFSKISTHSPLAVNGKVVLSPLTADRLPKSPVLVKSSSKKQSTVRKMVNNLDTNKENMDFRPSPLAAAADQLLVELPGQVKSSNKQQSALRKMTTLIANDKENMQKSGRKVEPITERTRNKSDEEKITDEDRVLEPLQKKSLRQLKRMFKEKLGVTETERKNDATEQKQLGSARPALRVLSENQMALDEVEGN